MKMRIAKQDTFKRKFRIRREKGFSIAGSGNVGKSITRRQ